MANFFHKISIKTKYGAMAVPVTPVIIVGVASMYIAWAYTTHFFKSKPKLRHFSKSMSLAALHGGKLALERLVDYHLALTDAKSLEAAATELQNLLQEKHPDFNRLQRAVAKLEMSNKEGVAVRILEEAVEAARSQRKQHEAYEIEMLLVEMLIYKGDVNKAIKRKCLGEEQISDARRPLYKAIICIMLDSKEKEDEWKRFNEIRQSFEWPLSDLHDSQLQDAVVNFDKFEKVVKLLKQHIKETRN